MPGDDHRVSGIDTGEHVNAVDEEGAQGHVALTRPALLVDDVHPVLGALADDRLLGNHHGVRDRANHQPHADGHPRQELPIRVGDRGLETHGAGRGIHARIDRIDPRLEALAALADGAEHELVDLELAGVALGKAELELERIDLGDLHDRVAGIQVLSLVDLPEPENPGEGRANLGLAQTGLRLVDLPLCSVEFRHRVVERLLGAHARGAQRAQPGQPRFGVRESGASDAEGRPRLGVIQRGRAGAPPSRSGPRGCRWRPACRRSPRRRWSSRDSAGTRRRRAYAAARCAAAVTT